MSEKVALRDRPFVFFDLETTGLDADKHEILEIGALLVDPEALDVLDSFNCCVKPEHIETADPQALKINGYSEEAWLDALPLKEGLERFARWGEHGLLVGYNVCFDWSFLRCGFNSTGVKHTFDYHRIDVPSIAFALFFDDPLFEDLGLRAVSQFFGIKRGTAHRALPDAEATYQVFRKLIDM
jgi:DNA polymerase-3 subunit epsilon